MDRCDVPQNTAYGFSSVSERKSHVFCPKPRRLGRLMVAERPLRFHMSNHADLHDSTACAEILDILLTRDNYSGLDQFSGSQIISSSPPYFCGSPPSRAANPLVHDACFMEGEMITNKTTPSQLSSPRKGGCVRLSSKFGPQPATVRIEGFDCLNSDSRSCGIPTLA